MKRPHSALVCAALFAALSLAAPEAPAANVKGNWTVAKRPQRRVPPRREFNFFGIFDRTGWPEDDYRQPRTRLTQPPEKPKIYVYAPPKTVSLSGRFQNASVRGGLLAHRIFSVLGEGRAKIRVTPEHRRAILKFYAARGFAPVWTSVAGIEERAFPLLEKLALAGEEGLDPALYRIPSVWDVNGDLEAINASAGRLARFDVELTAAALRYARHISGGMIRPNALSAYHDLHPPKVAAATALERLAGAPRPQAWLASLAPRHRAYRILKAALKRLRSAEPQEPLPPVAAGPLIRPGGYDPRIPLIRRHLERRGLLAPARADSRKLASAEMAQSAVEDAPETSTDALAEDDANVYDDALEKAVRAFQRKSGLRPDGIIGRGTLRALNRSRSGGKAARARRIALNLERLRWMPRDFGRVHFLANQPAFELYLVRDGKVVWKTRIIIGKPKNQTAFFSDVMEMVVFNPYWGVPQSIITKEMMPKLLRDPSWLDRKGFEVYDQRGRRISSAAVDWYAFAGQRKVPFDVRQKPGARNALGHIKFLFPNKHSIYMHDTPGRSLFNSTRRAFSHGCVRVQNPLKLAELVTGLDRAEIESKIAAGENERMPLKQKIPVHLVYFTAWPDEKGRIRYYADVYGRDGRLEAAMKKTREALRVRAGG